MARSRLRRVARAARWITAFAAVAVLLGVGAPALHRSVASAVVRGDDGVSPVALQALADAAARASDTAPDLHPAVPHGYRAPSPVTVAGPAAPPAAPTRPAAAASSSAAVPRATEATRAPAPAPAPWAPAPAANAGLPLPVAVGNSTQVITVVAPSSKSTSATLTAWQRGPSGWTVAVGPVTAKIGQQGVGQASETTSRTPAGTFTLTEGFGRLGNPGLRMPYRVIDNQDWWVSDVHSPLYNQHTRCAPGTCPFDESAGENLLSEGSVYNHALVIDYNRGGTPGAGSAFFLHVTNGAPTAGCVAIDDGHLVAIMKWLDPAARPLIAIGVG